MVINCDLLSASLPICPDKYSPHMLLSLRAPFLCPTVTAEVEEEEEKVPLVLGGESIKVGVDIVAGPPLQRGSLHYYGTLWKLLNEGLGKSTM